MAALYPGTSVSGYNSSPPPDDGSTGSANLITWNTDVKGKIGDPLNTFATNVDSNITAAFGRTIDGAGIVSTGVNYQVVAADQGKLIKATASGITITAPVTSVGAPFVFGFNNQSTGTITLAGSGANIDGAATQVIQAGGGGFLHFDGTNWFSFGLTPAQVSASGAQHGFDTPVNLGLTASNNGTVLTIAVKTKAGNDPSAGDPVLIPFRDATIANGDPVWVTLTGALNINTNAAGATMGTVNSVPFRVWVLAFNNAGSVVLAFYQTVTGGASPAAINPLNETALASSTGISAAATSAGTFYTPNGTTLSNKPFRIIGWFEYASGLATAGTYASNPTTLQLFGPGCYKPGSIVQSVYSTGTTQATTTSATFAVLTNTLTAVISPTSAANLVRATSAGTLGTSTSTGNPQVQLSRGSTLIGNPSAAIVAPGGAYSLPCSLFALDAPGTTSSTTYQFQGKASTATTSYPSASTGIVLSVDEIMA